MKYNFSTVIHGGKDQRMIALDMSIIFFHDCETSEVLSELEYTVSDGCFFFQYKNLLVDTCVVLQRSNYGSCQFSYFLMSQVNN